MPIQRQSNIELLRIIAITMVLMLHFNLHGLHPDVLSSHSTFSRLSLEGNLIESFCIAAVNVFVLISGYFSIKLSVRSVFNLYIRCFMIGLITYLAYVVLSKDPISISAIGGRVLAFTHNHWWFVISYLGLMAISPILNAGCRALYKRNYQYVLLLLSIVMLYFGWWKHLEITNGGYSLIHFIYLYIFARYIKLHVAENTIMRYRWLWLVLFTSTCIILTGLQYVVSRSMYTYDNPFAIIAALSLLLFFISVPFQNRYVNWAAASVFSAYLIQESPYLGKMWLYPNSIEMFANSVCGGGVILFVIFTLATLVVSIAADKLCVMPVLKWFNNIIEKYICKN